MRTCLSVLFICMTTWPSYAQEEVKRTYTTERIQVQAPEIDGYFDDPSWDQVAWSETFIGHQPTYQVTPSQKTRFKILYDAKFLYVAIRADDTEAEKIARRMSRRDGFEGDWVEINIDSYHDQRTAFSFTASVSGVKGDEYVTNNGENWDSTWDPIWYLKTSVDDQGWNAEFKIPLSQLRFANQPKHVWGIQLTRRLFRKEERSTWQAVDPNAIGWVHRFGELHGIEGIKPQKQLEVQPFIVTQLDQFPKEEENPFLREGREFRVNGGVDAKVGITSDITLDLTINPDFGQVEADPSVVNLSAFEQFFREQRPFFLEGNNLFTFPTSGGANNLFYSRRIGAPAHGSATDEDIAHEDRLPPTRILGAGKLTGKNSKGFSWGILSSLTNRVNLKVKDTLDRERKERIEPYTLYNTGRFQQDFKQGQTVAGAMFNHVQRFNNQGNELEQLHDHAISGGVDLDHFILDRKYGFRLQFSGSQVSGTTEAITETQKSNVRLFQRPDNTHRSLDTTRTQLTGTSSRFQFGKKSGNWVWETGINHRSPGLALNDVGFLVFTDNINAWAWNQYRIQKETRYFRSQRYSANFEQTWDFGGNPTSIGSGFNIDVESLAFYRFIFNYWQEFLNVSNSELRGGPAFRKPNVSFLSLQAYSNSRKKLFVGFTPSLSIGQEQQFKQYSLSGTLQYRPSDAILISLDPRFTSTRDELQYVETLEVAGEDLYLLGQIDRKDYVLSIRTNYNITPNLTIEFWAQPFISTGEYSDFKQVSNSTAIETGDRFISLEDHVRAPTVEQITEYESLTGNDFPDDDPAFGLFDGQNDRLISHFDDPDFNIVNFRSNLVLRWEYIPGSTLFAVWSSNGSQDDQRGDNGFGRLSSDLLSLEGSNIFLIKYTYRFIR